MVRREIVADHGHQPDWCEHRPGEAEIAGPAAEHVGGAFRRRVDRIERDRADHQDRTDGIGHQNFKWETTLYCDRLAAPLRNLSSIRKVIPTTRPPSCWTRLAVVFAVPPVASRSSTITTDCPGLIASLWISSTAEPYSSGAG